MTILNPKLAGKRALISGAASGIGLAVAKRFVSEGARVALLDRNAGALAEASAQIGQLSGDCLSFPVDVSVEAQVEQAAEEIARAWNGLDTVVCIAGIELIGRGDARVHELDLAHWQLTIDTNLTGTFLIAKHGIRLVLAGGGGGSVIITGSPTGLYGVAFDEHAYSASKAGTHGLMRAMAAGYASHGIRVNAVVPGFIDTPINAPVMADPAILSDLCKAIPMGRPGRPHEVAGVYTWLASDDASYVTGAFFFADGGQTAV